MPPWRCLPPALAILVTLSTSACGEISFFCLSAGAPGLVVEVRTAVTGAPVFGAVGRVQDGPFVARLEPSSGSGGHALLSAALDRPGTYSVTVTKTGYASWGASGVVIGTGGSGCGSATSIRLTAELVGAR